MATDTLCFGDADPVTGVPTIDGLVDLDFLPYIPGTDRIEPGYVEGSRLTFAGGTLARAIVQAVRQPPIGTLQDRLVLGFMVRFQPSFDPNDFLVIALHDPAQTAYRMIVINPTSAAGASSGTGSGSPHFIKTDAPPHDVDFYKNSFPTGAWTQYPEKGVEIKVRSWLPDRTNGSPTECAWSVELSFPRNAADASSVATAAGFPGSSEWIDLGDNFGLYFSLARFGASATAVQVAFPTGLTPLTTPPNVLFSVPQWGHGLIPAIQAIPGSNTGRGVRFKGGELGVGRRAVNSTTPTVLSDWIEGSGGTSGADNEIVALIENTSTTDAANDITAEFRFASFGMGPQAFFAWERPAGLLPNPTPQRLGTTPDPAVDLPPATSMVTPEATLVSSWPRSAVGSTVLHKCMWVQLSSPNNVNFTQASIRRNMNFDQMSRLEREATISGVGYPSPPDGAAHHDFVLETFCRPIAIAQLVKQGEVPSAEMLGLVSATLSHTLFANKDLGIHGLDFAQSSDQQWKNSIIYVFFVFGYRRTGTFITVNGKTYENLDPSPGSFGISAYHEGLNDNFSFAFEGPDMVQYQPGSFGLKVPHAGETRIKLTLDASPDGRAGDLSELPKVAWPGGDSDGTTVESPEGCGALLMRLIQRYGIWGVILAVLLVVLYYWLFT